MEFPFRKIIFSESETEKIAADFSKILAPSDLVCLNGSLGAGKTFFVKKICSSLGYDSVSSPTFAIVNEYNFQKKIYHFDFYRIKKNLEIIDIGFEDYLNDSDAIIFIEWAELFEELLPKKRFLVTIKLNDDNSREISIDNLK
ncbi:MAG: tRNA (adenosine(37)-N6)-threonylcarbamoyltransferase complex ATPase subunit type 1 TsaE [Chlorobiaceae bacterium]|nr:tRNA (adenosine(37)-N6)-threonylcarbamoyltransferase complex ATPase subunit type 1 TsaE [Chlorobiaceae bacterium]MBA4309364.1 tRNA (adenosine(37)-N6)-threonylcarbamoyltransferase complex ATPase subunit type 1 TsaE [Chlorobiaceae bacterium]